MNSNVLLVVPVFSLPRRKRDGRPLTSRKEIGMMRTFFKSTRFAAYALLCGALLTCSAGWLAAQAPAASTPAPAPAAMPIAAPVAAPAPAPTEATSTLTIRITGIRYAKGKIGVALFRDGKGFPADISSVVAATQVEIDPQTLTAKAVFAKLPQG